MVFWSEIVSVIQRGALYRTGTETKYIKLNTKTQNIFCCVNENLMTFLLTFDRGDKKTEGEKSFLF